MEPELRWWRVVLSWRGRIVRDECVRSGLSVGDATGWAIPGLVAAEHALVRDGRVCPSEGLAIEPAEGERTRLRSVAHPDVVLEVTAESGPRPRSRGEWLPGLARDAAYGLIVLGCVISFLAVARAQSDVEVRGEEGDGRIERAMHEAMPVAFVAPMDLAAPEQPMPEVEIEVEPIEEDMVLPEATPVATKPVAAVTKTRPTARKRESTPTQPSPQRDSHDAAGDARAPGTGEGLAAVAPAKPCADPRIDPKAQVDVVFVLDVSTTMAFVLDRLAREIAAVDAEVRKHDATPHYGLVVFVDDVQVVGGGKAFTDIDELAREFRKWSAFTADNGQIKHASDNLDWPENSLDALHAAATDFAWRDADDTVRVVVHATDDSFGKAGDVLSGAITVQHDYGDTVAALRDAHVRVATFTAPIGGQCECEDVKPGFMATFGGDPSLPDATGGAAFDIDDVAGGRLHFADAIPPLVTNAICEE
jgi:hypothetical protein